MKKPRWRDGMINSQLSKAGVSQWSSLSCPLSLGSTRKLRKLSPSSLRIRESGIRNSRVSLELFVCVYHLPLDVMCVLLGRTNSPSPHCKLIPFHQLTCTIFISIIHFVFYQFSALTQSPSDQSSSQNPASSNTLAARTKRFPVLMQNLN